MANKFLIGFVVFALVGLTVALILVFGVNSSSSNSNSTKEAEIDSFPLKQEDPMKLNIIEPDVTELRKYNLPRGSLSRPSTPNVTSGNFNWHTIFHETIPYEESKSFGHTISRHENLLFVGDPSGSTTGKVWVYQHKKDAVEKAYDFEFTHVGTDFQKGGYCIDAPFVSAPDYVEDIEGSGKTQGAIFFMEDLEVGERVQLSRFDLISDDDYSMLKQGVGFVYRKPYLYVPKKKHDHNRVDVYFFSEEHKSVSFEQSIVVNGENEYSLLGYGIAVNQENTALILSDPVSDNVFIYQRKNHTDTWVQTQVMSDVFLPDNDVATRKNQVYISDDSKTMFISTGDAEKVYVFLYDDAGDEGSYGKFDLHQTLEGDNGFGSSMAITNDAFWMVISEDLQNNMLHIYHWNDEKDCYTLLEDYNIESVMKKSVMSEKMLFYYTETSVYLAITSRADSEENPGHLVILAIGD